MRTMTEHAKSRKGRSSTAAERIVTAGLATATCIGVVGLLGTRMVSAQEVSAEPVAQESTPVLLADPASTVATSSSGMTRSDLDAYAALLAAEKDRLDAYRAELKAAARQINAASSGKQGATVEWTASEPVIPAPAPKPAPAAAAPPVLAAPAPQTYTKGS
jgi:hypothetical protein